MPNKNYQRAAAQERRVVQRLRAEGYTAARSAGSHSAYDVYAVKPTGETVTFVRTHRGVEYIEYVTPVAGIAIQCKRKQIYAPNRVSGRRNTAA